MNVGEKVFLFQSQKNLRFFGCQIIMLMCKKCILFSQNLFREMEIGHFFCPFLKSRIDFWENNMHFLHMTEKPIFFVFVLYSHQSA